MAVESSASGLVSAITAALGSASSAFPNEEDHFQPPADGISLLDLKNDLLLSYLQNLVFLVILKLRHSDETETAESLNAEVIQKLVELRVYLERGVRPLEGKLKYQIDKVVRAAEEADRRTAQKAASDGSKANGPSKIRNQASGTDDFESGSEESEEEDTGLNGYPEGDISVGPNPAALLRGVHASNKDSTSGTSRSTATGAYKPPRITPTAMPETQSRRDPNAPARKRRSQLLDEYIDEELSSAPRAQPSIGSNNTIVKHGRGTMSSRDRDKEREKTDYEERNFVRLPAESKADRRKARLRGELDRRDMFGGEDWTGLGGLGDRINKSVAGRSRGEGSSVLERREKRRRETQDGPRGDGAGGVGIGDSFEKKRKIMTQRADKKNRRRG